MHSTRPPRLSARAAMALSAATGSLLAALRRTRRFRPAQLVLAHWLQERSTIRQGFVALALCVTVSLLAGVTLGGIADLIDRLPGLLVLVPPVIGVRGAIFGALGARLGTGMLTGQFTLTRERRSFVGQNVEAAFSLSIANAGVLALLAWGSAQLLGAATIPLVDLAIIAMVGTLLSSVVVLATVIALARTAERRSWDMDAVGTPIISAIADLSTIPALVVGTLLIGHGLLDVLLGLVCLAGAGVAALTGVRNGGDAVRRITRESLPILAYTATIGILAGTLLQARESSLSQALLVAVPPFNASCGAIGGILSARLSSQLHLGLAEPRPLPGRSAALEGSLTVLFGVVAFAGVGLLTELASTLSRFAAPSILQLAGITLTGGLLAIAILFVVSYYAATASYRFGLDPDNVSIPVVTSTMDFFGILCLLVGITLFGGG